MRGSVNRPIDSIAVGKRTRKEMGDIRALAASINDLGLLHPIVVDEHSNLIAGQRRLDACKSLGWKKVPVHVVNLDNLVRGEFDENVVREDFRPSEKYVIEALVEEREQRAAKKCKGRAGQPRGGKFPQQAEKGKSRDKVAKFTGSSARTNKKIR